MTCHAETCFLIVINAVQTEIESGGSCMFDGVVLLKKSTGNVSRPRVTRSLSMDTTTYSIFFIQIAIFVLTSSFLMLGSF